MGSSDTEANALAVMPCTSPSRSTVMIVTPVAKHPIALRNSREFKLIAAYVLLFLCGGRVFNPAAARRAASSFLATNQPSSQTPSGAPRRDRVKDPVPHELLH